LKETNERLTVLPAVLQKNVYINKAAELCKRAAYTPEELLSYEAYKEHIRIEKAVRDGTRRDALAEGLQKGEAIGLQKGEANIYKKTIVNAYKAGHTIDSISTITGLPQEEIIKILKIIHDEGLNEG